MIYVLLYFVNVHYLTSHTHRIILQAIMIKKQLADINDFQLSALGIQKTAEMLAEAGLDWELSSLIIEHGGDKAPQKEIKLELKSKSGIIAGVEAHFDLDRTKV